MKKIIENLKFLGLSIALGIVLGAGIVAVSAWTEPTGDAPTGNLGAPINTGDLQQTKGAGLIVNSSGINGTGLYSNGTIAAGHTATTGQPTFFSAGASGGAALQVRYNEVATTNMPVDTWFITAAGAAKNIIFGRYSDNPAMTIDTIGRVGIGTTTPGYNLDVVGNLKVTGAYYDSDNAKGNAGQILSATASGTRWINSASGGGITGTGTANYVPKWTTTANLGNSKIFDNGFNVGIGTSSPAYALDVVNGIHASTNIFASGELRAGGAVNAASAKISNLNADNCDVKSDASGNLKCGTDATGSSGLVYVGSCTTGTSSGNTTTCSCAGTVMMMTGYHGYGNWADEVKCAVNNQGSSSVYGSAVFKSSVSGTCTFACFR